MDAICVVSRFKLRQWPDTSVFGWSFHGYRTLSQFGPGLLIHYNIRSWPLYLRAVPLSAARGPALVGDGRPAKDLLFKG